MSNYTKKHLFAPLPQTTRGQSVQLGGDPKGKHILYTNGKSVYVRDITNPTIATEYVGHTATATVARYSPSGYYIASADVNGNVHVWDAVGEDRVLKSQFRVLSGRINDLSWDGESMRIIAVGDGREKFGHAFQFDSGSSSGEISGHSKVVNSVSMRMGRPFRAVTASDDMTVVFHTGAPYKYARTIRDHTRFVQCVRFAPDGETFVSAGADGKLFLYDGKTGDKISELSSPQSHTGGIFSVSWAADSQQLLTASADMTAKIWDVKAGTVTQTFTFSTNAQNFEAQQVGCLWQGDHLVSLSLGGQLNYLDPHSGGVVRVVDGHSKAITALSYAEHFKTLFTGSYDGRVCAWENVEGNARPLENGHTNQVTAMCVREDAVLTVGMDDTLKRIRDLKFENTEITTGSVPKSVSAAKDRVVVASTLGVGISIGGKRTAFPLEFAATVAAISPDGALVAVGGDDAKVRLYKLEGSTPGELEITLLHTLTSNRGSVSALAFTPDSQALAAGDSQGKIYVYSASSGEPLISHWVFHTARINAIAWSADGKWAVSGSLDQHVYMWSREKPMRKIAIRSAHVGGVTGVAFLECKADRAEIVSAGQDACVKVWEAQYP
ncbi:uncharacterized protein VTP21DRAFT_446 [Calcarisporiella thermophila]|uniref:uncharacterized protein n=1 Tax=Calcarisporiella thermophila TaxID=911321 RepID=UPI0037421843